MAESYIFTIFHHIFSSFGKYVLLTILVVILALKIDKQINKNKKEGKLVVSLHFIDLIFTILTYTTKER